MNTVVEIDRDGLMLSMEQSWTFDPFFTSYVLPSLNEVRPSRTAVQEEADALGPTMVENLSEHGFLNEWTVDGAIYADLDATFVSTSVQSGQMTLTFSLTPQTPINLKTSDFSYRVFDPTYYIEILHAEGKKPRFSRRFSGCRSDVEQPDPPQDAIDQAYEIDLEDQGEALIGTFFAEKTTLSCR